MAGQAVVFDSMRFITSCWTPCYNLSRPARVPTPDVGTHKGCIPNWRTKGALFLLRLFRRNSIWLRSRNDQPADSIVTFDGLASEIIFSHERKNVLVFYGFLFFFFFVTEKINVFIFWKNFEIVTSRRSWKPWLIIELGNLFSLREGWTKFWKYRA